MLKLSLVGNLGNDPEELRYSADGRAFLRFSVAGNYRARDPGGEWQKKTEWVRVTVFGPRAEFLSQYLRKGSKVYVEGRLEARPWLDNQQQPRAGLEIVASEVEFMSSRADDEGFDTPAPRSGAAPQREAPAAAEPVSSGRGSGQRQGSADDADLEDLPF